MALLSSWRSAVAHLVELKSAEVSAFERETYRVVVNCEISNFSKFALNHKDFLKSLSVLTFLCHLEHFTSC